ncbi:unnamed protein product [Rotaria socialis]|uniref:Uncharacterized protein n=3 Tax=Rotaria socialis TaxID=392032 RepID=A0A820C2P0_9BILA|nr:unnamed protein product [Rotaria socialis]CAF4215441.1 unnamed protein product [Rotaria socialis]
MKTLHDTNNNYGHTASNTTQKQFSTSNLLTNTRQNSNLMNGSLRLNSAAIDSNPNTYPSLLTQNHHQQQTISRTNNDTRKRVYCLDKPSSNSATRPTTSSSTFSTQNIYTNSVQSPANPFLSMFNVDQNQLSSMIQANLTKFGGNQMLLPGTNNSLFYLQLMNANNMLMQQLLTNENNNLCSTSSKNQPMSTSHVDLPKDTMHSGRNSHILQADSNIFVPKTRPMTHDEIAEHAQLVYQRALQRNQLQQHNDLMKHFYESSTSSNTINSTIKSINNNQVPSVPSVGNIAVNRKFDMFDTMITSPSSCLSIQEPSVNAALSSLSLVSVDDVKIMSSISSTLDPSAPAFIPRRSQSKLHHDDDIETSSSSSDSDFNDFNYLDQFLEEFYNLDNQDDNHLIIQKSPAFGTTNIGDEFSNNSNSNNNINKHNIHSDILGQGDTIEQLACEATNAMTEQSSSIKVEKSECQYSIYELLNRYRNPRCHLVLPEWSRLSLILPTVCSMRAQSYKIKRYFAYRRRLNENQELIKDLSVSVTANIPAQS